MDDYPIAFLLKTLGSNHRSHEVAEEAARSRGDGRQEPRDAVVDEALRPGPLPPNPLGTAAAMNGGAGGRC